MKQTKTINPDELAELQRRIKSCRSTQRFSFSRELKKLTANNKTINSEQSLKDFDLLKKRMTASIAYRDKRLENLPTPEYPNLPVADRREEIMATIRDNQITIVCGETGSGKTTQLPKMCLELGRGVDGMIGHTQPRRLAARSVAARIAEELKSELGSVVGYKVRFHDKTKSDSYIKLMTDGILLAEIRNDRYLNQYDTLIVDEAHERSLNIDFLIGYLRWLLPRRKDLKVIITSATIDPERFAKHFNFTGKEGDDAPIIEVSGRTYPVEIRYHSLVPDVPDNKTDNNAKQETKEKDMLQAIVDATDELMAEALGGILVFLSGEREIREASDALRKHHKASVEILPLFARLSGAEQSKIFHPTGARRIILATNVAETSLTVPGVKYVIDTGLARISRYSWRSRIQRLPIEKISQASANQRSGRCGRTSDGIAIRLYGEDDFEARAEFTLPEIQRTNLASVILQLASLNLGDVYKFPYVEAPDAGMIRDGYKLLFELGAVNKASGESIQITKIGRLIAHLPIDPRLARMLLAAKDLGVLDEILVIVSALSIQDVRERPMDKQQASDQKHSRFKNDQSDFLSLLSLWDYYHEKNAEMSQGQLRKLCKREFLSFMRLREWNETYRQLRMSLKDSKVLERKKPLTKNKKIKNVDKKKVNKAGEEVDLEKYLPKYDQIHQSLLTGLLSNIGLKEENQEFLGANNRKFTIFPASGLRKHPPKWIMSSDIVETSRLFARTVAKIQPQWIEYFAKHLLKYHYSEPRWEKRAAQVAADERTTLYGITINPKKRINFGAIDSLVSRQLFIRHALVYGEYDCNAEFFIHNRALIDELENLEAKARRRDILVDEEILYDFYDKIIPENIYSGPAFEKWRKTFERDNPDALMLTRDYLMRRDDSHVQDEQYPDHIQVADLILPLSYHFEPGTKKDGVTVKIPAAALNQIPNHAFDYLVPGMLEEKIIEFIRSLPKQVRKQFVPAPEYAKACLEKINSSQVIDENMPIIEAISEALRRMTGNTINPEILAQIQFTDHMKMRYEVVDERGKLLQSSRELNQLKETIGLKSTATFNKIKHPKHKSIERENIENWDFDKIPETLTVELSGMKIKTWPALVDKKDSVAIQLFDSPQKAKQQNGVLRLVLLHFKDEQKLILKSLPEIQKMCLYYNSTGNCEELKKSITQNIFRLTFITGILEQNKHGSELEKKQFVSHLDSNQSKLEEVTTELCQQLFLVLSLNHEIRKKLKGNIDFSLLETLNDIKDQLEKLVYPGFLDDISLDELRQYSRYLKAILSRLEKLKGDANKDRGLFIQIQGVWDEYKKLLNKYGMLAEIRELRWIIEEFRVSLFAQNLGTAFPVSEKRLSKKLQEIKTNLQNM